MAKQITQRVWLSGASSGIGRALALALAKQGYEVIACARRQSLLREVALESDSQNYPGQIIPYALDVTDRMAHRDCIEEVEKEIGPIDIVICNAGYFQPVEMDHFNADVVGNMMNINFNSVSYMLEAVLPKFLGRGKGHIAIVASVAGYSGLPKSSAYGASKAALINLAESLYIDLKPQGIQVQVINPGFVNTSLLGKGESEMPFLISAEDAANRIACGLKTSRFEIAFPYRFAMMLKMLRILPYPLYFPLIKFLAGRK